MALRFTIINLLLDGPVWRFPKLGLECLLFCGHENDTKISFFSCCISSSTSC